MALAQYVPATRSELGQEKEQAKDKAGRFSRGESLIWVALVACVLIDVLYIRAFAVNVIWLDEWRFVPYLQLFNEGRLDLWQFLQFQHNEHKLFFPLMMLFTVARCTHYDGVAVQYLGLALLTITTVIVLGIARQRMIAFRSGNLLLALIACFMLDLRQWENLIEGFSAVILSVSMFVVLSIYFLDGVKKVGWKFWAAALSSFCATFSYANGLLTWPIGMFMLIGSARLEPSEIRKSMSLPIALWSVLSGLVLLLYFSNYVQDPQKIVRHSASSLLLPGRILDNIQALFASVTNSLCFEPNSAVATGIGLFVVFSIIAMAVLQKKWQVQRESLAPLALVLFGASTTVMIFVARAIYGISGMLIPRYAALTSLGIVGLLIFVVTVRTQRTGPKTAVAACLAYMMLTSTVGADLWAIDIGKATRTQRLEVAQVVRNYRSESDERLKLVLPFPSMVRASAPYLELQGYSVFKRH